MILLPHTRPLHPDVLATVAPLEHLLADVSGDDSAYWCLLAHWWPSPAQDVFLIEHDIVPSRQLVTEMLACPNDWCAAAYPFEESVYYGLGCTKFARTLRQSVPDLMEQVAQQSDDLHPAKHWCTLDRWMHGILVGRGFRPCVHLFRPIRNLDLQRSHHACRPVNPAPRVEVDEYGEDYWENFGGIPGNSYLAADRWRPSFASFAEGLIAALHPTTVLDVGCATGYLVEAFRERGVKAFGMDASAYALAHAQPGARAYCWRGSLLDPPIVRSFDLVTCIEVLEHLPPEDAERAVANLCAHTDQVVFSASPVDHTEPTHHNVREPAYWVDLFARQGFERDPEFDGSFIVAWAMRFVRAGGVDDRTPVPYDGG